MHPFPHRVPRVYAPYGRATVNSQYRFGPKRLGGLRLDTVAVIAERLRRECTPAADQWCIFVPGHNRNVLAIRVIAPSGAVTCVRESREKIPSVPGHKNASLLPIQSAHSRVWKRADYILDRRPVLLFFFFGYPRKMQLRIPDLCGPNRSGASYVGLALFNGPYPLKPSGVSGSGVTRVGRDLEQLHDYPTHPPPREGAPLLTPVFPGGNM